MNTPMAYSIIIVSGCIPVADARSLSVALVFEIQVHNATYQHWFAIKLAVPCKHHID
jgi:hypothetical protein